MTMTGKRLSLHGLELASLDDDDFADDGQFTIEQKKDITKEARDNLLYIFGGEQPLDESSSG